MFLMVCCAVSDRRRRTIPNSMICALLGLSALHLCVICTKGFSVFPYLAAVPLFYLCVVCWNRGVLGGGDVKLMTAICFYLGFWRTAAAFGFSLLVVFLQYGLYRRGHRRRRHARVALAPPLAWGCLLTLAGQFIMEVF